MVSGQSDQDYPEGPFQNNTKPYNSVSNRRRRYSICTEQRWSTWIPEHMIRTFDFYLFVWEGKRLFNRYVNLWMSYDSCSWIFNVLNVKLESTKFDFLKILISISQNFSKVIATLTTFWIICCCTFPFNHVESPMIWPHKPFPKIFRQVKGYH